MSSQDDGERGRVNRYSSVEAFFEESGVQQEPPDPQKDNRPHCPLLAAAHIMVRRALAADPTLKAAAVAPSVIVAVQVPGAEWVNPIAEAWRAEVRGTDDVPADGDDSDISGGVQWVEFRRDGRSRSDKTTEGNGAVQEAVAVGKSVYGFSPAPERYLPAELLRAADLRVAIAPLDGDGLVAAITLYAGRPPSFVPDPDEARLVMPDDLLLARRPGRDPDHHLRRSLGLAVARRGYGASIPRLADLHGMEAAVKWGLDLKRDLAEYKVGLLAWSEVDRGVLLAGPTGVGKTSFVRALAADCGVPLVVGSVGAWQASHEGHLGHMLRAMHASFDEARAIAPCVLCVDEIDGLGDRLTFDARYRDYSTQVLNTFLELLDGVQGRDGVVVVAATNRPDALDLAVRRPGRLDRTITIDLPDAGALAGIFRHHLGTNLPGEDLSEFVQRAVGSTGAHVERWVRGMRRRARVAKREPTRADLLLEMPQPGLHMPPEKRRRVAIHEAGHAVVIAARRPGALLSVTVGTADARMVLGNVEWLRFGPDEAEHHLTREVLRGQLVEILAGRAAEVVILGGPSAGAGGSRTSDLASATWLATVAVTAFGLGNDGFGPPPLWQGLPTREEVPFLLASHPEVAQQASISMADAYAEALRLVAKHRSVVEHVAHLLLEQETISGEEVERLLPSDLPTPGEDGP